MRVTQPLPRLGIIVRKRLSYANVVATLALFIALGGASYAAIKLPKNSVGSKQLKSASVGSRHLKASSVGAAQLQASSVGAAQLQAQSVGAASLGKDSVGSDAIQGNAVGAGELAVNTVDSTKVKDGSLQAGDLASGLIPPRTLFAHVSSSGTLGESSGVESAGRSSKGLYFVNFNRDLHGCVAVASVGFGFGPGVIGAGATAQARMNLDNDPKKVGITVYRKGYTFNDIEDNDVNVIVAC